MYRFKIRNNFIKKIIFYIMILLFMIIYISLILNTSISDSILNEINSRYNVNSFNIKDKLLHNSLTSIVGKNDNEEVNIVEVEPINKSIINNNKPKIYIYNTHDTEKYSLLYNSDYSITPGVTLASFILKDYLNDYGIYSYVQTKKISDYLVKHNLDYKGSYEASRSYLKEELKNNDYKIFIDIHRDSVKHKVTLYENDNKKYAKVMFVLTTKHSNYKENEKFVNELNNKINKYYNGLSRGIMYRKDVIFNQDISKYSTLIELGGVDNTLEEINNTLEVLAYILNEYIEENNI